MKKIQVSGKTEVYIKETLTTGTALKLMKFAGNDGLATDVEAMLEVVMKDAVTKIIVDGVEITGDLYKYVTELPVGEGMVVIQEASKLMSEGLEGINKDDQKK